MRAEGCVAIFVGILLMTTGGCTTASPRDLSVAQPRTNDNIPFNTGFINRSLRIDDRDHRYVVYVPFNYSPNKPWPLIVFLHGAYERGNDGLIQSDVGIGRAIRQHPDRFPCLVVMPQCPERGWWEKETELIDMALAETRRAYNVDPTRIYLTGLSMGGCATWTYGAQRTNVYAALIPICGKGNTDDANALAGIPIWVFHGAKDENVPVRYSRKMVDAIEKRHGLIKYTEYPEADHNAWDKAYGNEDTIAWLLSQKRK